MIVELLLQRTCGLLVTKKGVSCPLVEEYYTRIYKETDTESAVHGTVTSTSKGSSITIDSDYKLFVERMKTNKTNSFITELDHYLEEDVLPNNSRFDILLWWKLNGVKYPVL